MQVDTKKGRRILRVLLVIIGFLAALSAGIHVGTKRMVQAQVEVLGPSADVDRIVQLLGVQTWLNSWVLGCLAMIGYFVLRPLAGELDHGMVELERLRRDPVTGLPDKRYHKELLAHDLANGARHGRPVGMLRITIDGMNDEDPAFEQEAGKRILAAVAARLRDTARASDYVARIGGGEFSVVVPELRTVEGLGVLADRIIEAVRPAAPANDTGVENEGDVPRGNGPIRCSIGIAVGWPSNPLSADQLVAHADNALAEARDAPGGDWRYHASAVQGLNSRLSLVPGNGAPAEAPGDAAAQDAVTPMVGSAGVAAPRT